MPYKTKEARAAYEAVHRSEQRAANREWDHAHYRDRREYTREWRLSKPGKTRIYRLKTCYGLTLESFDAMLAGQGGVCAACGSAEWGPHGPAVDHDHGSGTIRGILCHKCNIALGLIEDDPARARALAYYLERKD